MSTNIKLSKAQIFKIIQSSGSFGSWLDIVGKKRIMKYGVLLAKDVYLN